MTALGEKRNDSPSPPAEEKVSAKPTDEEGWASAIVAPIGQHACLSRLHVVESSARLMFVRLLIRPFGPPSPPQEEKGPLIFRLKKSPNRFFNITRALEHLDVLDA
jgi:hypothetical protein